MKRFESEIRSVAWQRYERVSTRGTHTKKTDRTGLQAKLQPCVLRVANRAHEVRAHLPDLRA